VPGARMAPLSACAGGAPEERRAQYTDASAVRSLLWRRRQFQASCSRSFHGRSVDLSFERHNGTSLQGREFVTVLADGAIPFAHHGVLIRWGICMST